MTNDRQHMTTDEAITEIQRIERKFNLPAHPERRALADQIRLAARRMHWLSMRERNGVKGLDGHMKWDDADQDKSDREFALVDDRVLTALNKIRGASVDQSVIEFQRDPRGAPIIIHSSGAQDRIATFW